MSDMLEKYAIRADRRWLLCIAGMVWLAAGWRVWSIGYSDAAFNSAFSWEHWGFAVAVFFFFYLLIFKRIAKKHIQRIMLKDQSKQCIFSFFDFKSYGIMVVMIAGGVFFRKAHLLKSINLGVFYQGLGSALVVAGLTFLLAAIYFEKTKEVYLATNDPFFRKSRDKHCE